MLGNKTILNDGNGAFQNDTNGSTKGNVNALANVLLFTKEEVESEIHNILMKESSNIHPLPEKLVF